MSTHVASDASYAASSGHAFDLDSTAQGLIDFVSASPTPFHAVANAAEMLDETLSRFALWQDAATLDRLRQAALAAGDRERLAALLTYGDPYDGPTDGASIVVSPRFGTV